MLEVGTAIFMTKLFSLLLEKSNIILGEKMKNMCAYTDLVQ